jgi:hypothetical protein
MAGFEKTQEVIDFEALTAKKVKAAEAAGRIMTLNATIMHLAA